jgi:DNA-binding MarR family transcriptional regulator
MGSEPSAGPLIWTITALCLFYEIIPDLVVAGGLWKSELVSSKKERMNYDDLLDLPDFPSRGSIPYVLLHLSRLLTADFLERVASCGIAPAQTFVLRELWREEPLSQVEISQRLDIGKATVGQTLKRLERGGFVERRRSDDDGRIIVVYLTQKGRDVRAPLAAAAWAQLADVETMLGPKAVRELETHLQTLLGKQRETGSKRRD